MRLPRRVPWSSLAELEQVCSSIYSDENDIDAKVSAINRLSAWKAITNLPHAIDSTLALLVVIVQDRRQASPPSLLLRQGYATAILRLVNGLVDPLQVGTYARPIASIAQQLGLPGWLVELRHAATHEDMPSIDLLREAARQSMAWLLHNYYLPTLSPTPTTQELGAEPIRPLLPMLKFYKGIMKSITRDASLMSVYKPKLVGVLRDVERWLSECKVAVNIAAGDVDWTSKSSPDAYMKETWALEQFCDGLAMRGMLVPLSKKKRLPSTETFLPSKTSIAFWEPLLQHVQEIHTDLPFVLCRHFVATLLSNPSANNSNQRLDSSYDMYLAYWVMWAIQTWSDASPVYLDLQKDCLLNLTRGLRYESPPLSQSQPATLALLKALTYGQSDLEALTTLLLRPQSQIPKTVWDPHDLEIMKERNDLLQSTDVPFKEKLTSQSETATRQAINILGWRVLEENINWKPCPIGVYSSIN